MKYKLLSISGKSFVINLSNFLREFVFLKSYGLHEFCDVNLKSLQFSLLPIFSASFVGLKKALGLVDANDVR